MCLPLHRPHTSVLEKDPRVHFIELAGAPRVGEFVRGVILVDEVLQDGAGFEKVDGGTVGEGVCDSRDASVGVDGEEPWLFLSILCDVDGDGFVGLH